MALAASFSTLMAEVVYETGFEAESDFSEWTVDDANNDGSTWGFNADASPSHVFYSYNSANAGDDYLYSPVMRPSADGMLIVKYTFVGGSYKEAMEVYYGEGEDQASVTAMKASYEDIDGETHSGYFFVDGKAGVPFRIAFKAVSPADRYRLYLCSVKVETVAEPADIRVSEVLSPVTGKNLSQETVKVKVKNDGLVDVSSYKMFFSVNGVVKAEETVNEPLAAGAETEYTFQAKADMSAPREMYSLKAWTLYANDVDLENDTAYAQVRHQAAATVPYAMGFEPSDYTDELKFFNTNDDTGNWGIEMASAWMNMARTGAGCLAYNYDKNNNADDWAILEPINVEAGYYALKFWYSGDDTHPEKLAVYYGNEATPEAMTQKIVEYAPFARGAYEESINILHFDKPQTIYVGFHAFSDKDENWITVDDVSLTAISGDDVDVAVTEILKPYSAQRSTNEQGVTYELRNLGIKDVEAKVTVSIDGKVVDSKNVGIIGQEYKTVTVDDVLTMLSAGEHLVSIEVEVDGDANVANNKIEKTFVSFENPVEYWDFESQALPADFSYEVKDEGTMNPSTADQFNEYGWATMKLGAEHYMLGMNVLIGNTYIDNVSNADRWLVLPKMEISDKNCSFVFEAFRMNENYDESIQILVTEDPSSSWNYDKVFELVSLNLAPTTYYVDLSKFIGKEMSVVLRLMSKNGDVVLFDNLGFYGNVSTGIDGVKADDEDASVDDSYYNLQGMKVAKPSKGGIYIHKGRKIVVK